MWRISDERRIRGRVWLLWAAIVGAGLIWVDRSLIREEPETRNVRPFTHAEGREESLPVEAVGPARPYGGGPSVETPTVIETPASSAPSSATEEGYPIPVPSFTPALPVEQEAGTVDAAPDATAEVAQEASTEDAFVEDATPPEDTGAPQVATAEDAEPYPNVPYVVPLPILPAVELPPVSEAPQTLAGSPIGATGAGGNAIGLGGAGGSTIGIGGAGGTAIGVGGAGGAVTPGVGLGGGTAIGIAGAPAPFTPFGVPMLTPFGWILVPVSPQALR